MYTNIGFGMNRYQKCKQWKNTCFSKANNKPIFIECKKNIYSDHVAAPVRDTTEVEAYRQKYSITVGGDVPAPNPIESFDEMKEIPKMSDMKIIQGHPSPMQSQAWPIILSGHDMIGLTRNGHDRTRAYMLPAILHIDKQNKMQTLEGPVVLILTHSTDLSKTILQIAESHTSKTCRALLVSDAGRPKHFESCIKDGVDMIVSVAETALIFLRRNMLNLNFCSMVIVDEVDFQIESTNGEILREILKYVPAGHQMLWFSQSWFEAAQQFAVEYMPNGHCLVDDGRCHSDVQRIFRQQIHILKESKCRMLYTLNLIRKIQSASSEKILIFTKLKDDSISLAKYLNEKGVTARSLNDFVFLDEVRTLIANDNNTCLVTMNSTVQALAINIEHVIYFSYKDSSYGMHLSNMRYSSTNCTSYVILGDTEHNAAKSMIEQLKYGNQEIPTELLKLANQEAGPDGNEPSTCTVIDDIDHENRSQTSVNQNFEQEMVFPKISKNQSQLTFLDNFIKNKKNIYSNHVAAIARTTSEIEVYCKKHDIVVGGDIFAPNPIETFEELKEIPELPRLLRNRGLPNPFQSQAWPIILSGHDMIGLTRNGHDRTFAYMIPAILHIQNQTQIQPNEGPIVLILTQSRELGLNIRQLVDKFPNLHIQRTFITIEKHNMQSYLRRGVDMVISVAKIALSMLRQNMLNLKFCSMVIVDDVDAQMAATNGEVLREILEYAPAGRQTLWFSQSWCAAAQQLAVEHMPNGYCSVDAGKFHRDVQRICRQQVHILKESDCRKQYTLELIRKIQFSTSEKILIFALLKKDAISLDMYLKEGGISAGSLIDVYQEEVQELIDEFSNGNKTCVITLDSTAQDLADVFEHVIHFNYNSSNYGMRLSHMSYSITGGTSHVILCDTEHDVARSMVKQLKYGNQEITDQLLKLANLETGNVEKDHSNEEIPSVIAEASKKTDTQPLELLPESTIKAPMIKTNDNSTTEIENIGTKPSTSTAEKPLNLVNIPKKQYESIFIECKKDIYSEYVDTIARTTSQVEAFRKKHDITVRGDILAPDPIVRFKELKDIPLLPNLLTAQVRPNPMQSQAWPIILSGHDMIGLTRNGHERTLAYILPALLHIKKQTKMQLNEGPIVLILTQFTERCMDIVEVLDLFDHKIRQRTAVFRVKEIKRKFYTKGLDIVIAVSNVALFLLRRKTMNLNFCSMVIVDDVDAQMVETNGDELREILKFAPVGRQTLFFSQSWFAAAQKLAVEHMSNGYCSVDARKLHNDVQRVCRQQVHILQKSQSRMLYTLKLICEIQSWSPGKIIVFTAKIGDTMKLAQFLNKGGIAAESFTRNVSSEEPQRSMESFRKECNCLVTMDLNVEACLADDIEHVIHFSYNSSSYGSRLRHMRYSSTGGTSHVILNNTEHIVAKSMIEQLKYGKQGIPAKLLKLANHVEKIKSKKEIRTSIAEVSAKSDTQSMVGLPQSTNVAPMIKISENSAKQIKNKNIKNKYSWTKNDSKISENEKKRTIPSAIPVISTTNADAIARNPIPTSMNIPDEEQPNLINIATKQYQCNVIECKKDMYSEHVAAIVRTTSEIEVYRRKRNIIVGGDILAPNPIIRFEELKKIPVLPNQLWTRGHPNPMQSQAWPIILSGHDMIGLTRNGHGRTFAYMLPAILHIQNQTQIQPNEGPIVLILTQSTQLSINIRKVLDLFCPNTLRIQRIFLFNEKQKFQNYSKKGMHMVIAVPEIALSLLKQNTMNLKFCSMVIVDDVDAQMAATNGEVLREILKYAPAGRQTLWFSQSWFAAAQQLAVEHMPNGYCSVDAGKFHRDVQRICRQEVYILKESDCRKQYSLELIRKIQSSTSGKILIFTEQKEDSISLVKYLKEGGITAGSLNDIVYHQEVQELIEEFRNGKKSCLVTLDSTVQTLADDIEHVIHFNYNSSNYGMRLSHMSYSSTGGTSHVILYDTERNAAKSMIEQLKYGNQVCAAKSMIEQLKYRNQEIIVEKVQSNEEILNTIVKVSDGSDIRPVEVLPQNSNEAPMIPKKNLLTKEVKINTINENDGNEIIFPNIKKKRSRWNYLNNFEANKKNIYSNHVVAIARTASEIEVYRKKHDIMVGGDIFAPNPIETFEELKEIPELPRLLRAGGHPNPFQSQAWPIILSGHDMIGLTRNDFERTCAYMLPAILHIHNRTQINPYEGPIVLILTQSKEPSMNILKVLDLFCRNIHIERVLLFNEKQYQSHLKKGIDVVIAVPEIALFLLKRRTMNLQFCSMVIVDDVDDLMAATNGEVLRETLKYAPAGRQTLWFSQSWFAAAQQFAIEHMPNGYCSVDAGKFHRDVQRICRQQVHILTQSECRELYTLKLIRKIQSSSSGNILIFTALKEASTSLAKYLNKRGITAGSLNDVVNQKEVQELLDEFKIGNKTCLITLDSTVQALADDIEHVIHFSYNSSNYGSRLRHMRYASSGGTSHVMLYDSERKAAKSMIEQLKYGNKEIPAELLRLAYPEAGHVHSKEEIRSTKAAVSDKSENQPMKHRNQSQEITAEFSKPANQEVANVKKVQPKEEFRTSIAEVRAKSDTQTMVGLPPSTNVVPMIKISENSAKEIKNKNIKNKYSWTKNDSKISENENNCTIPSAIPVISTTNAGVIAINQIPTSMNKQVEKQPNLSNIATKQYLCNANECKKDIYSDHVDAIVRTTSQVEAFRKKHDIIVGGDILAPNPIERFEELKDIPLLPNLLTAQVQPNPMQSQAWPIILSGHDMIGLTRNGHERTLAYILPALLHINKQTKMQPNDGPIVLILTQSKDRAMFIFQVVDLFRTQKHIRKALFTNDMHKLNQMHIRKGIDMVIAVAENALTLLRQNVMNLQFCSMVIVDDVDAHMAATNGEILREILKYAPVGRQTLWFSQSWFAAAQKLAVEHMPNGYCSVDAGKFHRDVQRICRQRVHILKESGYRKKYTLKLIRKIQSSSSSGKILIFTVLKEDSISLAKYLKEGGITAGSLNDIVYHQEVQDLIEEFKNGEKTCLVTLDSTVQTLADGIEHVIHFNYNSSNYGMRLSHMSYSRAGGTSHIILCDTEYAAAKSLIEQLKYGNQEISAELLHQASYVEKEKLKEEGRPSMEKVRPSIEKLQISKEKVRLSIEKVGPSIVKVRPSIEKVQTSKEKVRPSIEKVQISKDKVRPSIEKVQTSMEKVRPSVQEVRPSIQEVRPSVQEVQPLIQQVRPSMEKARPSLDTINDKSKTQPLKVHPHRQIKAVLTSDLNRETISENSAKTVESKKANISKLKIEFKRTMPNKFAATVDNKRIRTVSELISEAKKRKIVNITQILPTDKWIGANDILRRILIADAKKKSSLSTNSALPLHETISADNTLGPRMSMQTIYTSAQACSTTSNPGSSIKRSAKNSTSPISPKRFRYEDLYGVSDDSD